MQVKRVPSPCVTCVGRGGGGVGVPGSIGGSVKNTVAMSAVIKSLRPPGNCGLPVRGRSRP